MFPKSGPAGVAANSAARPASASKLTSKRARRNGRRAEVGNGESAVAAPRSNRLNNVRSFMIFEPLGRQVLPVDRDDQNRDGGVTLTGCCYNAFSGTRSKGQATPVARSGTGFVLPKT